jgi:hypothetical protein
VTGAALILFAVVVCTPIPPAFDATPTSCASYWSQAPAPTGPSAQCNALALLNENRGS